MTSRRLALPYGCALVGWFTAAALAISADPLPERIDFGLHIRPILSEHCFHCHGPDPAHREAELRLDDEESARQVLTADHDQVSEFWKRITSTDPELQMPPPDARKTITEEQRARLSAWLKQGAPWGTHWAFAPLVNHPLPAASSDPWARTAIDAWVLQGLRDRGLAPSPTASPYTLIRRMHLDLTGLPPSPTRVQHFVQEYAQNPAKAMESLADELLQDPAFGEHWARLWLDLARYADTKGYEKDLKRDMWPYRDWVVGAFQQDMPFPQFTIEQLAGDLLENPSQAQRIATAFHRATLSNDEGGTDDEEFRVAAVKDRVDTTIQVWMGLTMGCAKCHSHKYDPLTTDDYYRFYAIFNQTEDADRYDDEPRLALPTFAQQAELLSLQQTRDEQQSQLQRVQTESLSAIESQWRRAVPSDLQSESGAALTTDEEQAVVAAVDRPERDTYTVTATMPEGTYRYLRLEALMGPPSEDQPRGSLGLNPKDPNFVLSEFSLEHGIAEEGTDAMRWQPVELISLKASFEQQGWPATASLDGDSKTGWAVSPRQNQPHWIVFELKPPQSITSKSRFRVTLSQQYGNHLLLRRFRLAGSEDTQRPLWIDAVPEVKKASDALAETDRKMASLREGMPRLPIMKELPSSSRRSTRIHTRGNFLDPGDEVTPALPSFLEVEKKSSQPSRLHAALWLTDSQNPLTPRVMVNRIWAQIFGRGIVMTEEDFGAQGAMPSHPELLDALALAYRDRHGWSLKRLLKEIVLSNTYQQAYRMDDEREKRDPENRWLSRGARFRLPAEVVRDQALGIAGLLSRKQGGPPVMPPQPEGLWRSTYSGAKWITSQGEDRYRRGIYTFWKRTTPYPSMETFDATTREVCQIRRISTNTPLQALVTLNDPVYVEASLAMAQSWIQQSGDDRHRVAQGLAAALSRPSTETECDHLMTLLKRSRLHFSTHPEAARDLISYAAFSMDPKIEPTELASWSIVASAVLNLDELMMRP